MFGFFGAGNNMLSDIQYCLSELGSTVYDRLLNRARVFVFFQFVIMKKKKVSQKCDVLIPHLWTKIKLEIKN